MRARRRSKPISSGAIDERTVVQAARLKQVEVTDLHRDCFGCYIDAGFTGRAELGRVVAASSGGLRVTKAGRMLVGARPGFVWQRKTSPSDIAARP
jgi:hypothetical protein